MTNSTHNPEYPTFTLDELDKIGEAMDELIELKEHRKHPIYMIQEFKLVALKKALLEREWYEALADLYKLEQSHEYLIKADQ